MISKKGVGSPLDDPTVKEYVLDRINAGQTNAEVARDTGIRFGIKVSETSVRRAKKRWGVGLNVFSDPIVKEDVRPVDIRPGKADLRELANPEKLLEERGVDPEEWDIDTVRVGEWDGPSSEEGVVTYHSMKLGLRRNPANFEIKPVRSDGWTPDPEQPTWGDKKDAKLVVIVGDQQAPFHDETLDQLFQAWLQKNRPDEGVLLGDTVDFPDISRHRYNPESTATVNACTQSGYDLLRGYVQSSQGTSWRKLPGNHDERIRNYVIDVAVQLYGIKRASKDGEEELPSLSVPYLLRLDELGIDYIDPQGEYAQGQINVSKRLAVRHGWLTRKGSGASALGTLEHLGYSVVVGHTHRQSIVHKTTHDIEGTTKTITGVEAGCMCKIDGLGYAVAPDWQQGFATATVWPDGTFKIDLATYVNNVLYYRDQRISL